MMGNIRSKVGKSATRQVDLRAGVLPCMPSQFAT
jgi:hypothetical protein